MHNATDQKKREKKEEEEKKTYHWTLLKTITFETVVASHARQLFY